MVPDKNSESSPPLHVVEISSDSEGDLFSQPCRGTHTFTSHSKSKHLKSASWENDIIELTDSESDDSSDLPSLLSPLVRGSRTAKGVGSSKRRPSSKEFVSLYVDTDDEGESNKDCILVLNDAPGSRWPIRRTLPAGGQDVARSNPVFDSPKKNTVPVFPQVMRELPGNSRTRPVQKAEEQARQKYATVLFTELNKEIFGDRLPKNTTLEWSKRLLTTAGRARWHRSQSGIDTTKIELASKILDCNERIRNTLSHEMCHLACWVVDNQPREGHGQLFKSWADKVMNKYPDIHISTRHNYEISYPFEWKCEKCMKIYGRYSKSIRPNECVCGACKVGKLIPLFIGGSRKTPKISRLAVVTPRESPYPLPTNLQEREVTDLVIALRDITIDHPTDL